MNVKEFIEFWSKERKKGMFAYVVIRNLYLGVLFFVLVIIMKYLKSPEIYRATSLIPSFSPAVIGIIGFSFFNWLSNEKKYKKLTKEINDFLSQDGK